MELYTNVKFEERDEAQEFHQRLVGADFDLLKMDAGLLNFSTEWVMLPDLFLVRARAEGHGRWQSLYTNGCPNFFFSFDNEHMLMGKELSGHRAIFGNARQVREGVYKAGANTLDITVSIEMSDQLGWDVRADEVRETDPRALKKLWTVCLRVTRRARDISRNGQRSWPAGEANRWQVAVLEALENAARPWLSAEKRGLSETAPLGHQIVLSAEQFFHEQLLSGPIEISYLAKRLGVPERTLYHHFRRVLGVGPRRYMELLRLGEFRRQLLAADGTDEKVLQIALDLGFTEFGRLANKYKEQFGERPSETLRRP